MTTYDEEQRTAVTLNCLREWLEFHCRAGARTDNLNKPTYKQLVTMYCTYMYVHGNRTLNRLPVIVDSVPRVLVTNLRDSQTNTTRVCTCASK